MQKVKRLSAPLDTHDATDGSGLKVLDNCLGYRVGDKEYWVEKGFYTDFASIPSFARILVRWNKVDDAAVIHDKPFRDGYIYDSDGRKKLVSLREINKVFRKIAQHTEHPQGGWFKRTWRSKDRANPFQAWGAWSGLFIMSWKPWIGRPKNVIINNNKPYENPLKCV